MGDRIQLPPLFMGEGVVRLLQLPNNFYSSLQRRQPRTRSGFTTDRGEQVNHGHDRVGGDGDQGDRPGRSPRRRTRATGMSKAGRRTSSSCITLGCQYREAISGYQVADFWTPPWQVSGYRGLYSISIF